MTGSANLNLKTRLYVVADLLQMPLNFDPHKLKLSGKQGFQTATCPFEYELAAKELIEYMDDSVLTLMSIGLKGQAPSPLLLVAELLPGAAQANLLFVNSDKLGADFPGWKMYDSSEEAIADLGPALLAGFELDASTKGWTQTA